MKKSSEDIQKNPGISDALTELIRHGARQIITEAVEIELSSFLNEVSQNLHEGKARVVRNGYLPEREILTGIGKIKVRMPRVRDRGEGAEKIQFKSSLIPPYMRRTATLNEVLPLLYLKGISEADFTEVLSPIFGEQTKNLSPGVISRLKMKWEEEYVQWHKRGLSQKKYVYWWVDGVNFHARSDDKRCVLVVIGVNTQGEKELIALEDGFRESTESWLNVLRNLKDRGINSPVIAVGDGALGFWNAVTAIFPETKHQRCWFHKMGNVLDKLPKSQQNKAKSMLHEIWMSATKEDANTAFDRFVKKYEDKYPKATECLLKDKEALLTFYDFPARHWVHLRTTNPIESTFATIRNRTYKSKGAFSSKTILTMSFKLMEGAQKRWNKIKGFRQLEDVINGIKFINGEMVQLDNKSVGSNEQLHGIAA